VRNLRRDISFFLLIGIFSKDSLSRIGHGDVSPERDHAEAGRDTLATAETPTAFQFSFKRNGKDNHKKIGGSIEQHGQSAENHELNENMTLLRGDELRNEGKKKQSRLRVEHFGENPLTKSARCGGLRCADYHLCISSADHSNTQPYEIRCARVFDGVKRYGRSRQDRGDAEGGGENMEEPTDKGAQGGKDALAAASGEAARQNIEDAWPRSDCQHQRSSKEKQEMVSVEHLENCMGQGPRKQGGLPIENCRLKTALSLVWLPLSNATASTSKNNSAAGQKEGGRWFATAKARSRAMPTRPSVPSSKRRPIKVTP